MALKSSSVLDILLPPIIIMMRECSQALNTCRCAWCLSCGCVSSMLLVLSITFHCHYYIWGCMCSPDTFQFWWLKRYILSSCYYHHEIGSINLTHYHISVVVCLRCLLHYVLSLIAYTLRETRDFVFIIILLLCSSRLLQIVGYVLACSSYSLVYTTPFHYTIVQTYLKTLNL